MTMLSFLKSISLIAVLLYLSLCALLYVKQRTLIFHSQPKTALQVPSMELRNDGQTLQISLREAKGPQAVIYFGGNAEDVSHSVPPLADAFPQAAIYAMHYRSYGQSTGQPSEVALLNDARALYALLRQRHSQITVIGRSLGSGVAVQLAAGLGPSDQPHRLILVTPYSSIADVAAQSFWWVPVRLLLKDKFDSVAHTGQLKIPTLILKAEHDEVIPAWSTDKLAAAVPQALLKRHTLQGAGHNSIDGMADYWQQMAAF
jgi:uncharacterized protein